VRFFLDNNVDTAVSTVLFRAGHICWTAASAGLAAANDDSIAVYADEKDAVLVSHDRAFAERHRRNTTGKHLWLRCEPADAAVIVGRHLPEILQELTSMTHVVVEVSAERVRLHPPRWE
jgi:predicted nuclease of predicted toxin-antitoxin system